MVSAEGPRRTTDVFIVGGGPAGLAASIAAREQGLDVMVADGVPPPIDKACGEGVTPNGVAALRSLGVEIRRHDAVPFRGIRFIVSGLHADAAFVGEPGWGIRRTTLHHVLVERAAAVGVRLQWQTRVLGLIPGGALTDAGPVAISASRRLPAVTRGRVALIGEASGSVDATTGKGLSPIFRHALALADALSSGDLRSYEASHRRILRAPAFMARLLLAMDRSPWLRRRALRAFTVEPGLFSRLLALHVGAFTPPRRAVRSLCTLGWRLLTA